VLGGTVNITVRSSLLKFYMISIGCILTDCGIRPATSAEAEWLQDYIHKSNNNAGQSSVTAARLAHAESANRGEDRSDEDEDDDSEGVNSVVGSKRSSLMLTGDMKGAAFADMSDKTPTAATLLSQAQSAQRPPGSFPPQASIRRHPQQEPAMSVQSHSPQPGNTVPYLASQPGISVRQIPQFPSIDEAVGTNSTSPHGMAAREVWGWFQDHLDALLESVRLFRFDQFEMHLRTFWSTLGGHHREVVHAPAIAGLMAKADAIVYDVRLG
jgi:regulatory factor X, other